MNNGNSKQERLVRDYFVAFLVAASLVAVFALLLRSNQHGKSPAADEQQLIFSLDLDDCDPKHKSLIHWLEIDDPRYIPLPPEAGPNRDYAGRNWVYRGDEYLSVRKSFSTPILALAVEPHHQIKPHTIAVEPGAVEVLIRQSYLRSAPLISEPKDPKPAPPGVYWVGDDGMTIVTIPPLDLAVLPDVTLRADDPTRIEVELLKDAAGTYRPRIQLRSGSGNMKLDVVAVRHLMRYLGAVAAGGASPERKFWSAPHQVSAFWDRVPGISYRADIHKQEWAIDERKER